MEVVVENDKLFIVLDRFNLNIVYVDGFIFDL